MDLTTALLLGQATNLIALVTFGFRIMRFVNRIEFRVDLLWRESEQRRTRQPP